LRIGFRLGRLIQGSSGPGGGGGLPLIMPKGGASGFATCDDFVDSVGVNVSWASATTPFGNPTSCIAAMAELGVRHCRDALLTSWMDWRYGYNRTAWRAIQARNLALPGGEQPIFAHFFTSGWTTHFVQGPAVYQGPFTAAEFYQSFSGGHQHYNGDAGLSSTIPGVGTAIPNGATTNPAAGPGSPPANWAFSDPEYPWSLVGGFAGPNEPGVTGGTATEAQHAQVDGWLKGLFSNLNGFTSQSLGSFARPTADGEITTTGKASELPFTGVVVMDNGLVLRGTYPDWSQGTNAADLGDVHPYHTWCPSWERVSSIFSEFYDPYSGRWHTPSDTSRALPYFTSEWGYISRGTDLQFQHSGYWVNPPDVIAEYMVRQVLLNYRRGIRRSFVYTLMDLSSASSAEQSFGLCNSDFSRKAQFYSLRNLLKITGFSRPTTIVPLQPTITGFVPGPANQQTSGYSADLGQAWDTFADRLDHVTLGQSDGVYVTAVFRQFDLYNIETHVRRSDPAVQNLTVTFPVNVSSVQWAQPTLGGTSTPNDGQVWTSLSITGGNQVTLPITAYTKLLKWTVA
jgi:hypothetical protein